MAIPASAKVMTFISTHDRNAAKAFYGGLLGFALTHEDDFAAVFDLNGIMLRVSTVPGFKPVDHTVLGWQVSDIAATVKTLRDKGLKFNFYGGLEQDALGIWPAPGGAARVAWFDYRDGNVLSLTQF